MVMMYSYETLTTKGGKMDLKCFQSYLQFYIVLKVKKKKNSPLVLQTISTFPSPPLLSSTRLYFSSKLPVL